jgi:hypothetical protein
MKKSEETYTLMEIIFIVVAAIAVTEIACVIWAFGWAAYGFYHHL